MSKTTKLLISALLCLSPFLSRGQAFVKSPKDHFEWRLRGRFLLDGGLFINDKASLNNGLILSDMRLGAQLRFLENWNATLEVGYSANKVSLKDVFVNYKFNSNTIQLGHYYEPFGESRTGTTNFRLMSEAPSLKAFTDSRKLGATYQYATHSWNLTGGVFSNTDISANTEGDQGYALSAKVIGRPYYKNGNVFHLAASSVFSTPNSEFQVVRYSAGIPTSLIQKNDNRFVDAQIDQVTNSWKFDCEMVGVYNKWYAKANYIAARVNRFGAANFRGQGCFAEVGYLILGKQHNYNSSVGFVSNPTPGSLEVLVRYDYIDLNDSKAEIYGGYMQDVTAGCSYYINKYVAARLNYVYMKVGESAPTGSNNISMMQARIQLAF